MRGRRLSCISDLNDQIGLFWRLPGMQWLKLSGVGECVPWRRQATRDRDLAGPAESLCKVRSDRRLPSRIAACWLRCWSGSSTPTGTRKLFSCQPHARSRASAPAYVLHGHDKGSLDLAPQERDLLAGQLRRYGRDRQLCSPAATRATSSRARAASANPNVRRAQISSG